MGGVAPKERVLNNVSTNFEASHNAVFPTLPILPLSHRLRYIFSIIFLNFFSLRFFRHVGDQISHP